MTSAEAYPHDSAEMASWVASAAGRATGVAMRVLEIGCGDGAVTRRLAVAGFDVVGVDPSPAITDPLVRAMAFEELDEAPFDAVFASVSLHHLEDPAKASAALRRLTKPDSVMLVREFDKSLLDDEHTLRWWFHQRQAAEAVADDNGYGVDGDGHDHPGQQQDFEQFVQRWREEMEHHVSAWATVLGILTSAGFATQHVAPAPYLYRWGLAEAIRPLEEDLIARHRINAVGIHWHGRRS